MAESLVYNMDCLEYMKTIPDKYFDLLVTDPPYNTTNNKWDVEIDLPALWMEWNRIVKINGAMIFTSAQPFTTHLINSNIENFRYDLIWEKSIATGFLNANKMPLRGHEIVCLFYRKLPAYNPVKHKLDTPSFKKRSKTNSKISDNYGVYHNNLDKGDKEGNRHPRSIFTVQYENSFFDSQPDTGQKMIHPTQKPIALFKYLIHTYSNKGDNVLDCYLGSGSSRIAADELERNFIGCELDKDYFEAQEKRYRQYKSQTVIPFT